MSFSFQSKSRTSFPMESKGDCTAAVEIVLQSYIRVRITFIAVVSWYLSLKQMRIISVLGQLSTGGRRLRPGFKIQLKSNTHACG